MKKFLQLLLCIGICLCSIPLIAQQIDYTLRYNLTTNEYEVYGKPDFSNPNFFVGGGSQISLVLPSTILDSPLSITSVTGGPWFDNSQVYAPAADNMHDFHGIASNGSIMAWVSGQETLLFRFSIPGADCLPGIRLFENASDPQDTDAGMAGGDFNNFFADAFTFSNLYNANYDNLGTSCDPPVVLSNPLTITEGTTGTICSPILDLTPNDEFEVTICGVEHGTVTETIDGATLCLEYTPTAGYTGTDSICVIVCDKVGFCDETTVPVLVVPPLQPVPTPEPPVVIPTPITLPEDSTAMVCTPILDPNTDDTFTATLCTGSPANGTAVPTVVDNSLCIEYTPNTGYTGTDPICVEVCDQDGLCETVTIPVTIIPTPEQEDVPQAPVASITPIVTPTDEMASVCGPVIDANPDDTHTATICGQPANGTATVSLDNATGQVCVEFDPNAGFVGSDNICVTVCDQGNLCTDVQVPVVVYSTNTAPIAVADINTTTVDTPVDGSVLTNDEDPEGDMLSVNTTPVNETNGTVVIDDMGNYTFTPTPGFEGEASFQYAICDDGAPVLCDTATVTIDVIDNTDPANNEVIGVADNFVTENDNPLTGDLLANDSDPDGDDLVINTTPVTAPTTGTLVINTDGTFSFTPDPDFVGTETFEYEVCDDGTPTACETATVSIEILPGDGMNDLYATDDASTAKEGETQTGNVTDNDNDPENGTLTVATTPVSDVSNGTVTINPDGSYMYEPTPGFIGNDQFSYTVCDDGSPMACDVATVYLTVLENQNPPLVIATPLTTTQDTPSSVCTIITDTNEGDTFTATLCPGTPADGTANITVDGAELCIEYTPTTGYMGTDSVCVTVCDQTGLCTTVTVPVTVVPPLPPATTPKPPVVIPTPITVPEDSTTTVCTPILDANTGDTFTATLCTGSPANGTAVPTIDGNSLCIEYTPNTGYTGDDPICVEVCDQDGLCDTVTIPVSIIPTPLPVDSAQAPVAVMPPVVTPVEEMTTVCGSIIDANPDDTHTATICGQPANGTATISVDNATNQVCLDYTPDAGFVGSDNICITVCDQSNLCTEVQVPVEVTPLEAVLSLKVMLQGALFFVSDGLMRDDLRQQDLIPLNQPYTAAMSTRFTHVGGGGSETTTAAVLATGVGTGDAIVDWVFVELRDGNNSSTVLQTMSALVQRDGDVVSAADGQPIIIDVAANSIFVSVKHRNHLGAMSAQAFSTAAGPVTVDFTTMTDADLYNQTGYDALEMTTIAGHRALWAGNANADGKLKYDGSANDRIVLAGEVWQHPNNTFLALNFNSAIGYYQGDVNMDGKTKYDGSINDRVMIQNNVLLYNLNTNLLNNFNSMLEQLP